MTRISTPRLFIVIAALLIIASVGFGFTRWNPPSTDTAQVSDSGVNESTSKEIDTSDWKTYSNKEFGFAVKYPITWIALEDWGVSFNPSIVSLVSPQTKASQEQPYPRGLPKQSATISIYVYDNISELDISKRAGSLLSYLRASPEVLGYREIQFNGYSAYGALIGGHDSEYAVFLEFQGRIYEILIERRSEEEDITGIEATILSTFKLQLD